MWSFAITRRDQLRLFRDAFAQHVFGDKGGLLTQFIAEARPSHFDSQQFFKARRVGAELIGGLQCWDLSVDHEDELFVLENGLIVSNTKHNAGQAKGKKSFSGFDYISQFVQIPEEFKDRAAVSEEDGVVEAVREAPQGGHFIVINGREHFALPGFSVSVKPGDSVEKGDILSDGLANPADIVRLRGLGEGRRYYAERLAQILDDSGQAPDRRNLEIIAKATVDHYRMDDPDEDSPYNPDDLVRSSEFLRKYKPPADTSDYPMHKAQGKYLQQPVLHFTPGTRLTPKMIRRMEDAGVSSVLASGTAPSFSPDMRRLRVASHTNRDWLASMHTSYLSKQLVDSVERGDETNIEENRHFAPRLAYGKDFGKNTDKTGKF
jgi:hypothetical protein